MANGDPLASRRAALEAGGGLSGPPSQRGGLSRWVSDASEFASKLPRAIGEMIGAPLSDIVALGHAREDTGRMPTATANLAGEWAKSAAGTAGELATRAAFNPLANVPKLGPWIDERVEEGIERNVERGLPGSGLQQQAFDFYQDRRQMQHERPFSSRVENVGNLAIGFAGAGRAAGTAATRASARAGGPGARMPSLGRRSRPLKGRDARLERRRILDEIRESGGPGSTAAAAEAAFRGGSHPYISSYGALRRTRAGERAAASVGEAATKGFEPFARALYEKFPEMRPENRSARRLHQEIVKEPTRDMRMDAMEGFDVESSLTDIQRHLRALEDFEPEVLERLGQRLPDRSVIDRARSEGRLEPQQTAELIDGVLDLQRSGEEVMPGFAGPEGRLKLELARLSLDEQAVGMPADALVDMVPWLERYDVSGFHQLRNQQRLMREQGFDTEALREFYGGDERPILPEHVLDPRIDELRAERPDIDVHLQSARDAWRHFNDPLEESLVAAGRIPEEGTRFRRVLDEDGNPRVNPDTDEFLLERVAEPSEPVPMETQGPSAAQGRTLRQQRRELGRSERALEKRQEQLAEQNVAAQAELHDLERGLARDMETLSKRARAAGDDPEAAHLWDQWYETVRQYDDLVEGGGLRLPERMRASIETVEGAMDEVIALSASPALRQMLDPQSNARIQNALAELRGAEEFLTTNAERMRFFDTLDAAAKLGRETARGRAAETRAQRGQGPRQSRAERAVLHARERVSTAQDRASTLFDFDSAVVRLERAVERYQQARQPFKDTLLKRQTRAREKLKQVERQRRSVERLQAKFDELQAEIRASIEAQPSAARDILWLERSVSEMRPRLDAMVEEGLLTPEVRAQLDVEGLPQTLEEITGAADETIRAELSDPSTEVGAALEQAGMAPERVATLLDNPQAPDPAFDVGYVPDYAARPGESPGPAVGAGGRLSSPASTTRRRVGSTGQLEPSFREIIVRRQTELRVEQFKQQFADEIQTKFGAKAPDVLRKVAEREGHSEQTVASWLEDQPKIERMMRQEGYVALKPGELFEFRQRRVGPDPETAWVSKDMANTLKSLTSSNGFENFLREIWNPGTTLWKRAVLALRPAWHVFNAFGDLTMSMVHGRLGMTDLLDFMPLAAEAWRRNKYGYDLSGASLEQLPMGALGRRAGRRLQEQGVEQLPNLPESADIFSQGISRRELKIDQRRQPLDILSESVPTLAKLRSSKGAQVLSRVTKPISETTRVSYRANAAVDDMFRAAIYLTRTMRHGDSPTAAATKVSETLGNYQKMSPFEKNYIRSAFPFYAWVRHISVLTARQFHPDNLMRTMILGQAMQVLGEPDEHEALLPGWASGDLHLGFWNERPIFLGTRGLNPFTDVLQPLQVGGHFNPAGVLRSAHPALQIGFEQGTGLSTLSGRPFSTPVPRLNDMGQEVPTAPPLREQLIQTLPQLTLGRDIYRAARGETLARWGTGEAMNLPGVESPPIAGRIGQMAGLNVRPIEVEQIRERQVTARYQQMRQQLRHEGRREAAREREGLPLLPEQLGGRPSQPPNSLPPS